MGKSKKVDRIDIGNTVLCDLCNEDFTNSNKSGGFIYMTKGICPNCAGDFLKAVKKCKEEMYISQYCPKDTSFADFIRNYRGDNNFIEIISE